MNKMTPRERLDAFMSGNEVDRLPNLSLIGSITARYTNTPSILACKDYDVLLEGSVAAARDLEIDYFQNYVQIGSNLVYEANGYDLMAERTKPGFTGKWLEDIEDAQDIVKPDVANSAVMKEFLEKVKKAETYTDDLYTMTAVVGPATTCGSFFGVEDFLVYTITDMEEIERLFDMVTDMVIDVIRLLHEQGLRYILIPEPTASLLTPAFYKDYILPRHKRIFGEINKLGMYGRLHMCGDTSHILPYSVDSGANIIDVDHGTDFAAALELAKGKTILNGNIDPVEQMMSSTPEKIHEDMIALSKKAEGYRALLMPGCEIPAATESENVKAISKALYAIAK